jgi:hypothetical protein
LALEYEAVLKRPEQIAASRGTVHEIDKLMIALIAVARPVYRGDLRPQRFRACCIRLGNQRSGTTERLEADQGGEMRKSNFALRLQPSLLHEARRTADEEGIALNQFINVAVAEKLSAIRTESFFRARAARHADIPEAIEILKGMGKGNPPTEGDELPESERLYALGSSRGKRMKQTGARRTRAGSKKP